MAVVFANCDQKYQGVSSDDKPMGASNGATFHTVDTGELWVFHEGAWVPDLRVPYAMKRLL